MSKYLFVVEKKFKLKFFKEIFEKYDELYKFDYNIVTASPIIHPQDKYIRIDDTIISEFESLQLKGIDIPDGTYLVKNEVLAPIKILEYDKVISLCDDDIYGKLIFVNYLQKQDIPLNKAYFYSINDYRLSSLKVVFTEMPEAFSVDAVYKELIDNNFECPYADNSDMAVKIGQLRGTTGFSRKEFGDYFGIPYRTIENWEKGTNKCPEYVYQLMQYKLQHEKII